MFSKFLRLEVREFFRSPQLTGSVIMKVSMVIMYAYFTAIFLLGGFGLYYGSLEEGKNPLKLFCKFFIIYWFADLLLKYFIQNLPANNVKPFLTMNIPRQKVAGYTFTKILLSFFSWAFLLFAVPFTVLLLGDGTFNSLGVVSMMVFVGSALLCNTFVNVFINKNQILLYTIFGLIISIALLHYFEIISVTDFSEKLVSAFYEHPVFAVLPVLIAIFGVFFSLKFIRNSLYLDKGLELKKSAGKTEDIAFLKRFGTLGTFINNDIRLLRRSKTARNAALGSLLFLFYGFLSVSGTYKSDFMQIFVGIFVTGGFNFVFGQRVPAWDSSYYPLMMTQNVPYRDYLRAKWSLFVIFTICAMILSTFYIFFSLKFYFVILGAGFYNLGVNSYLTLLAGAFNKKPIDLDAGRKAFSSGQQNFNTKLLLLIIPQMLLPMAVFSVVQYFAGFNPAVFSVACLGLLGFLLRNKAFDAIVKIYKTEKYTTLASFGKADK